MKVYTIGVYGTTEEGFYRALWLRKVGIFVDIRQRRGMRNPRYKYVNSTYLQTRLREMRIPYAHIPQLAPSTEMRQMQQDADKAANITKGARDHLCPQYTKAFTGHMKDQGYTLELLLSQAKMASGLLGTGNVESIALFCVERNPNACHRSLVASEMEHYGADIAHIRA